MARFARQGMHVGACVFTDSGGAVIENRKAVVRLICTKERRTRKCVTFAFFTRKDILEKFITIRLVFRSIGLVFF